MNDKKNLVFLIFFVSSCAWSQASSPRTSSKRPWLLSSKSEAAAAHRFSLAEWLDTKSRNNSMDMWLGYNTNPDVYEFKFSLSSNQDDVTTQVGNNAPSSAGAFRSYEGEFAAYAKNVGLTLGYHDNNEESFTDTTGLFNFRVFGKSMQTSHFTLHYGLRTRLGQSLTTYRLNQQFPAATLQVYLVDHFGIYGHYRKYLKVSEAVFGDTEGNSLEYGVFIEYGILRIFGHIYEEDRNSILNNVNTEFNHKGTKFGIQFYF